MWLNLLLSGENGKLNEVVSKTTQMILKYLQYGVSIGWGVLVIGGLILLIYLFFKKKWATELSDKEKFQKIINKTIFAALILALMLLIATIIIPIYMN